MATKLGARMSKGYLTTGKIAKMFKVAPRTVAKWIDTGMMKGTKIPGGKHRRVEPSEVVRFAEEHHYEIELLPEVVLPVSKTDQAEIELLFGKEPEVHVPLVEESRMYDV